jgi:hypothetical protein
MGRRYYRRRNSNSAGALIRESVKLCNRLPWWGAALTGAVMFSVFYWAVPAWIHHQWESTPVRSPLVYLVRQTLERRIHWIQYLGIVLGLIGAFFAIKNYFWSERLSRHGEQGVGLFTRFLGRLLDHHRGSGS